MARLFALFLVLALLQRGQSESLPVTVLESSAPAETANAQAVYDQDDTIFFVGGGTNGYYVTSYSIANDTFTILPTYTPTPFGSCVWGGNDSFYYLERSNRSPSRIFKMSLNSFRNYTASLLLGEPEPAFPVHGSIVSDGSEYVYIIGGLDPKGRKWVLDKIYRISLQSDRIDEVVRIPSPRVNPFSAYDPSTGSIFMFGGTAYSETESVLRYDTSTGNFSSFDPPLERQGLSQVVWAGTFALIIHSDRQTDAWNVSMWSPDMKNRTEAVKLEYEKGVEPIGTQTMAVYVDKLKRVYVFGDVVRTGEAPSARKAMYIDVSSAISAAAGVRRISGMVSVILAFVCALRSL